MNQRTLLFPFTLVLAAALSGCGIGPVTSSSQGEFKLTGMVHGGQQPVVGSTIALYRAGKTGNGSASTSMLTANVTTDVNGFFGITGDYTCVSTEDQVYIVATGGNPGAGTNNSAMVMMDPLGRCGDLNSSSYITINEVTTAAAAYALSQFMVDATHVGASSTNALGLKNAFLDAKLLADTGTGTAATLPSTQKIEQNKLYALADALAPCVNSNGGGPCNALFAAATPPTGSPSTAAPTNTLGAVLNIVKYPGSNVANVYALISPTPPFATAYTQAPNDWTMTLTLTGGGMGAPEALGIDNLGNLWVASYSGPLSSFSPQGTPLSATGYGAGYLGECFGLTIDTSNNVWVTNQESPSHSPGHGSVVKFQGASAATPGAIVTNNGSAYNYDSTTDFPTALTSDNNGNIMIANFANSTASVYSSAGVAVSTNLGLNNAAFPVSLAADQSHGVWLANQGDSTVTHVDASGNLLQRPNCCSGANGIALDSFNNAWVSNYYGGNVTELNNAGVSQTLVDNGQDGGLSTGYPSGIAIDAAQNVWVTDFRGTAISGLYGNASSQPAGTAISPSMGFGLDAALLLPFSIAPDASGNLWVSNNGNDNVVMFFGLATPTATPRLVYPVAP